MFIAVKTSNLSNGLFFHYLLHENPIRFFNLFISMRILSGRVELHKTGSAEMISLPRHPEGSRQR
jgi:hypothetical protein